ncbi:hypothetical protein FDP41_011267 [Naegleria fowleri]|uniref:Uncharacterized protein n=1 Tax=Naegleria fowleri TaxID=5763 RepID=A0A6A5BYG7_NAEFO|nr:uncharacterized protein FDP41_011267 [Naegleria fowleri]KAF0982337.1 hypothetical protein FDP41_011267 [Naegleria fowleri]
MELKQQVKSFCENAKQMIDKRGQELNDQICELCREGTDSIRSILKFKEIQADMKESFENIHSLGAYALIEAKITKFIRVQRDFNELKHNFSENVKTLHLVQVHGLDEGIKDLEIEVSNIGNVLREPSRILSVRFSNLGTEGPNGPTSVDTYYSDQPDLNGKVTLVNGIQQWTVPFDGRFLITAAGAAGGSNPYNNSIRAGYGAEVSGVFQLNKGTVECSFIIFRKKFYLSLIIYRRLVCSRFEHEYSLTCGCWRKWM